MFQGTSYYISPNDNIIQINNNNNNIATSTPNSVQNSQYSYVRTQPSPLNINYITSTYTPYTYQISPSYQQQQQPQNIEVNTKLNIPSLSIPTTSAYTPNTSNSQYVNYFVEDSSKLPTQSRLYTNTQPSYSTYIEKYIPPSSDTPKNNLYEERSSSTFGNLRSPNNPSIQANTNTTYLDAKSQEIIQKAMDSISKSQVLTSSGRNSQKNQENYSYSPNVDKAVDYSANLLSLPRFSTDLTQLKPLYPSYTIPYSMFSGSISQNTNQNLGSMYTPVEAPTPTYLYTNTSSNITSKPETIANPTISDNKSPVEFTVKNDEKITINQTKTEVPQIQVQIETKEGSKENPESVIDQNSEKVIGRNPEKKTHEKNKSSIFSKTNIPIEAERIHEPSDQAEDEYIKFTVPIDKFVKIIGVTKEEIIAGKAIKEAMMFRDKYVLNDHTDYSKEADITTIRQNSTEPIINYLHEKIEILPVFENTELKWDAGVFIPYQNNQPIYLPNKMADYFHDFQRFETIIHNGSVRDYSNKRLNVLDLKFRVHTLYNTDKETEEAKKENHRDFYNVRKIDTHIHLAACFPIRKFMKFIGNKLKTEPNTIVSIDPNTKQELTLKQVFDKLGITERTIDVDSLDMQADMHTFQRFDNFNKKYNPLDQGQLRNIFLQSDNVIKGRFLAEITKSLMTHYEEERYEFMEWRISIHGKSPKDASRVANWIMDYKLCSHNNRWLIQVPRLYASYKKNGLLKNFGDMIKNIFQPLFEVTIDPSKNPKLFLFLLQVVGFDSVDDESVFETSQSVKEYLTQPDDWDSNESPPYCYWNYYLYANVQTLNKLRKARGLNTFQFRPHCGEAGPTSHLASSFLLADSISHGIKISKSPVLQYLYYLKQIGLAVSPISNNKLFLKYDKNPFPKLFKRGLNVCLSTDDPLILHSTNDPLLEEYAIASEIWSLSPVDLCEIARNSVVQSGYEETLKKHWIGEKYNQRTKEANDITKTNIPMARFLFRLDTLNEELDMIDYLSKKTN